MISSSVSMLNQTFENAEKEYFLFFESKQTPVTTSCGRPLSERSIEMASSYELGLPRTLLSKTTIVSAVITISFSLS